MKIVVCMATYNGEKFISEQIDSILNQSYSDFSLYISDDGSTDETLSIINRYINLDDRIILLNKHDSTGSAKKNFLYLLEHVEGDLFLFCDQDDIWTNDHIELLINSYNDLDEKTKENPVVVHADCKIVNQNLDIISESLYDYLNFPPICYNKNFYFMYNNVTGGVSLINNVMKRFVFNNKKCLYENLDSIFMHDMFFATIAAYFGKIISLDSKIQFYRQHESNVVGVSNAKSKKLLMKKIINIVFNNKFKSYYEIHNKTIENSKKYAEFFLNYYFLQISDMDKNIIETFINIKKLTKLNRIKFLIRNGFTKKSFYRNFGLFLAI